MTLPMMLAWHKNNQSISFLLLLSDMTHVVDTALKSLNLILLVPYEVNMR